MSDASALARKHLNNAETSIWGGVLLAVLGVYFGQQLPVIDVPSQGAGTTFSAGGDCIVLFHLAIPAVPLIALVFVIYWLLLIRQIFGGRAFWLWILTVQGVFRMMRWPYTRIAGFTWPHEPPWPDALGIMPVKHRRNIRPIIGPITPEKSIALRNGWKRFDENRCRTRSTVPQSRPFS